MQPKLIRRCLVETLGTFALVLGIGLAINRGITPLYPAAIILAVFISFYGYISGGHFNPAVTLAFTISKKFPFKEVIPYWISQVLGANMAIFLLENSVRRDIGTKMCINLDTQFSNFSGQYTPLEPLLFEIMASFLFVTLILNIVTTNFVPLKAKGIGIGLALVAVCTLFGNSVFVSKVDLSLDPARTLGPALFKYQGNPRHLSTNPDGTDVYSTTPHLKDGLIIALMSLIGGALAGTVHFIAHKEQN